MRRTGQLSELLVCNEVGARISKDEERNFISPVSFLSITRTSGTLLFKILVSGR